MKKVLRWTEGDQFDDLKTRDRFAFFLIFHEADEDTFNIIVGVITKYTWDILQKTYEKRKTVITYEVMELEEGMYGIQEIYKFKKEMEEVKEIEDFKEDQLMKDL